MDAPSKIAEVADRLLIAEHDTDLVAWLQARVDRRRTYQEMADGLVEATGIPPVSAETVRRWVKHYEITETEPAA